MLSRCVTIANRLGLHARPAALFSRTAAVYSCKVTITKGAKQIDAKSILSVMTLAIKFGDEITITTDGPNEKEALEALVELVLTLFGEE